MHKPADIIEVAAAVIVDSGKVLLCRRSGGYLDGLWEFPGGKIDMNEDPAQAASREIMEELNLEIVTHEEIMTLDHRYPDKCVRLHFILCKLQPWNSPKRMEVAGSLWISPADFPVDTMCPADRIAADKIDWNIITCVKERK